MQQQAVWLVLPRLLDLGSEPEKTEHPARAPYAHTQIDDDKVRV